MTVLAKQINDLTRSLEKQIGNLVTRKDMRAVGELSVALIVNRTRSGRGVKSPGGNVSGLKSLSEQYILFRQRNRIRLSNTTSPSKSNLTFSGQMLESISVLKVSKVKFNQIVKIGIKPNNRDDGKTNTQVINWVSNMRPFFFLSKGEATKIRKELSKRIKSKT